MAVEKHHLFQGLATLELPKDVLEHGAEPLGCEGIKSRAHVGVARDTLDTVDVCKLRQLLLIKGEERGRLERKHGERRHEGIRQGNVDIRIARVRDIGEAVADQ